MCERINLKVILTILFFLSTGIIYAQQLAFPTAEGYGKYAIGGRGGKVYEVTNLNDSGAGSLRAACEASGPRTVIFRVSGTIELKSSLKVKNPYITIAGQTAPGDGICLRGYPLVLDGLNHGIIRYLRVRFGDESGQDADAVSARGANNMILDHISASWSVDETMSIYFCENLTVQWCMISESMYHSNHVKENHGFGGIWGGNYSSYHHNLIASHSSRNPRFASGCGNTDFRNNVIYNWGYNSAYGGEKQQTGDANHAFSNINMVANYFKPGPATSPGDVSYRIINPSTRNGDADYGKWYVADNVMVGSAKVTANNWDGGVQPSSAALKLNEAWAAMPINQQTAEDAYYNVIENVGATLPKRDVVDTRIINDVLTGTATFEGAFYKTAKSVKDKSQICGIIDSQNDVGGWPLLVSAPAPDDSDHDGMPDAWEIEHGLSITDPEDRNIIGNDGYTNLEIYLNSITKFKAFLYPPTNVTAELIDLTKAKLTWKYNNNNKISFRIERAEGDSEIFSKVAELQANDTTYVDSELKELTKYNYRIIAYNDSLSSSYERIVTITTLSKTSLPIEVTVGTPKHNAGNIVADSVLTWEATMNAESYDVYFGTETPPPFVGNQKETIYIPGTMNSYTRYYWKVNSKNANGVTDGATWSFRTEKTTGTSNLPNKPELAQVYPNPFSDITTFKYSLKQESDVKLVIFNTTGQTIRTLINQKQSAGEHSSNFDGSALFQGIYIYSLKIGEQEQRGKIMLNK